MINDIFLTLKNNWRSGLSVSMITIPLSISVAVASGGTPMHGILTGIWGGIFGSVFASSKHNVLGPASAFSGILLSFSLVNGIRYLPMIAICSGLMILMIYIFRITKYITLIPTSVIHGFMFGVGISIFIGQINSALGLNLPQTGKLHHSLIQTYLSLKHINYSSFILFSSGFLFLQISKSKYPRFPAIILLTFIGIGCGYLIDYGYLDDIMILSDRYQGIEFSLYQNIFAPFEINGFGDIIQIIRKVFGASSVIAIIAILETVVTAKIAQKITDIKFSKEKEVFGLALSNIASGIFGGLPAAGAPTRTYLNINMGATSRSSAFMACTASLVFAILFFNDGFLYFPIPIIAAILINIAIKFMDVTMMMKLYRTYPFSFYVAFITAFMTVVVDPTYGIIIGTILSLMSYLKNITKCKAMVSIFRDGALHDKLNIADYIEMQEDGDVVLLKFSGGLNYMNHELYVDYLEKINKKITLILSFSHMLDIDIDGIEMIDEAFLNLKKRGIRIYFSGLKGFFQKVISKTKVYKILHNDNGIIASHLELLDKQGEMIDNEKIEKWLSDSKTRDKSSGQG